MTGIENFPINAGMLYSAVGSIAFAVIMTQWLKQYLQDWRFTSLLCLFFAVVFEFVAAWISQKGMNAEIAFAAFLLGVLGASVATFGYEMVVNLLGKAGVGPRSDERLVATAKTEVKADAISALSDDEELERALAVVERAGLSVELRDTK